MMPDTDTSDDENTNSTENSETMDVSPVRIHIIDTSDSLQHLDVEVEKNLIENHYQNTREIHNNSDFDFSANYRSNSPISISNYGSRENSFHGSDNGQSYGSDNGQSDSDYNDPIIYEYDASAASRPIANIHAHKSNKMSADINNLFTNTESNPNDAHVERTISNLHGGYKQLGYNDTVQLIDKYYDHTLESRFSNEIDILTTYLKGQKHIYIEAKHFTQWKLNCLMFPTLTLTAFITIVSPFIECNHWSTGFTSGINAVIALFITMINYLKLESHIEIYMQRANHFDKLETSLEFANNKLSFLNKEQDKQKLVLFKLKEVEKKIGEMKESSIVFIPDEIKLLFPIICNINIFAFIKKMELYKKNLIVKFKDIKNEIRYILYKLDSVSSTNKYTAVGTDRGADVSSLEILRPVVDTAMSHDEIRHRNRLEFLNKMKDKIKDEIFEYMSVYSHIDEIFSKEIKMAGTKKRGTGFCLSCLWKSNPNHMRELDGLSPVINKYFRFIFADE